MLRCIGQEDIENVPQAVIDQLGQALQQVQAGQHQLMSQATVQVDVNRGTLKDKVTPFNFVSFNVWKQSPDWQPTPTPQTAAKPQLLPHEQGAPHAPATATPQQAPVPAPEPATAAATVGPFGGFGS